MTEMNKLQQILTNIQTTVSPHQTGEIASYIPELASVDPNKFGMHISTLTGDNIGIGDYQERFSIQSITKVLLLAKASLALGPDLFKRVDVEPSGDPFNSLVQLEHEQGIPRNPFINAGAIVLCDVLVELLDDPKTQYLNFVRHLAGSNTINYIEKVVASEKAHGFRNTSIINFMKSFGNIHSDIDTVLDLYFHACAIAMSCQELSRTFTLLANSGKLLTTGETILCPQRTKRINAIMQTCGLYDEAGEFAFRVGLPAKSGVGGGIVAIHPGQFAVATWSPRLNPKGNSATGIHALELLTSHTGMSIF
ncbi:MAG: glutaminase [Akkermansiaceae bacterium]